MNQGWIGVDFDGTLAHYDTWMGWNQFGAPIQPMVDRVRGWLAEGKDVRIFTARVPVNDTEVFECRVTGDKWTGVMMKNEIANYCQKHLGQRLRSTCVKDMGMIQLWDDRAVQVVPNTGRTLAEEAEANQQALDGKAYTGL